MAGEENTTKIAPDDCIISPLGYIKCKCIVMDTFPSNTPYVYPEINGKIVAWFRIV